MRIQHNLSAMNAHRNLGANNMRTSKNLEKLSSGFRINRAGDDAAGLAISEKMRAQISGLSMAQKNAHDGISLIQTAEGGLNETHSILQRMKTLATQSANGTYDSDVDRANIQKEVDALKSEIDRISDSTNYNGINLLDGSLGKSSSTADTGIELGLSNTAKADGAYKFTDAVAGAYTLVTAGGASGVMTTGDKINMSITYNDGSDKTMNITLTAKDSTTLVAEDGSEYTITSGGATAAELNSAFYEEAKKTDLDDMFTINSNMVFTAKEKGLDGAKIVSANTTETISSVEGDVNTGFAISTAAADSYESIDGTKLTVWDLKEDGTADKADAVFEVNGEKFMFVDSDATDDQIATLADDKIHAVKIAGASVANADVISMVTVINNETGINAEVDGTTNTQINLKVDAGNTSTNDKGLTLQIGDTAEEFNKVTVSVGNMDSDSIGVGSIDVSSQKGAANAIEDIKTAINNVSSTRGDLGALQNRLEHTINNLSVTEENMTSAESRIRDVDMAKEMMDFTKNNILNQAAQAMLAQANQQPQGVLQLLQ